MNHKTLTARIAVNELLAHHPDEDAVLQLARRLYAEGAGGARPDWDALQLHGATQTLWLERAALKLAAEARREAV